MKTEKDKETKKRRQVKRHRVCLVAVDVRSAHNIGALFRTCDGLGAELMIVGASPRPAHEDDSRLPYVVSRAEKAIHKTALGAEKTVAWRYAETLLQATHMLADEAFTFVALEQTASSEPLEALKISANTALVVGREVEGLTPVEVRLCTGGAYEIPMLGDKESLNVSVASGIALYHAIMSHKE